MKHLWLALLLCGIGLAAPARAEAWTIPEFSSVIEVQPDASIEVTETIRVDFDTDKHGIFRNIPFRYQTEDGQSMTVPIDVRDVRQDDQAATVATSREGDSVVLKIGDPDRTITGPHTYVIRYVAQAAINFFEQHDELYWNVTGTDWEVPIERATAMVRLPGSVAPEDIQVRCFTGGLRSTEEFCESQRETGSATFSTSAGYLTAVVGWPKNIITKPADYDAIRQQADQAGQWPYVLYDSPWKWIVNIFFPIIGIFSLLQYWLRAGRDPKTKETSVVQYDPPAGLTPGEMGVVIDERANHSDIVATIVDMAVRGYLDITESKSNGFLGIGGGTDYILTKKKEFSGDAKLQPHEVKLLEGLFEDGDSVNLKDLKGSFHTTVRSIEASLYTQVAAKGFFHANPKTVRMAFLVGGLVAAFASFYLVPFGVVGPAAVAVAVLLFSGLMPKRTQKGADAFWHAKGFKEYLAKAEKYRLKWQEQQNMFEAYLPYAMAFGVADKWSKAFEGIQQTPPSWYHGTTPGHFNSLLLWSALNDFSHGMTRSFAPPAASGSSGFGGGGFSGGGFGGGGGGSW